VPNDISVTVEYLCTLILVSHISIKEFTSTEDTISLHSIKLFFPYFKKDVCSVMNVISAF
jgi:hypothetical protein